MSSFWENNKEGIISGAKSTGKFAWKGTKTVSKAGYRAAKNSSQKNSDGNEEETENTMNSLPSIKYQDPKTFAPPPLKPGQLQYHSKNSEASLSLNSVPVQNQQQPPPAIPVRTNSYQPTVVASAPIQAQAPVSAPAPVQFPPPTQAPLPNSAPVPAPTPVFVQESQLDYSNPYYQGITSTHEEPNHGQTSVSQPPPLAERSYVRPQVGPPATPSPDLSNFSVPPKLVQQIPILQQVPPAASESVIKLAVTETLASHANPPPLAPRRTQEIIPHALQPTIQAQFVQQPQPSQPTAGQLAPDSAVIASTIPSLSNTSTNTVSEQRIQTQTEDEKEDIPVDKGIAGVYSNKVDVKFAPPPKHRDLGRNNSSSPPPTASTKGSKVPLAPPRSSLNSTHSPSPPPPLRTSSTPTMELAVNFPPPPRPSQIGTGTAQHITASSHPIQPSSSINPSGRTPPPPPLRTPHAVQNQKEENLPLSNPAYSSKFTAPYDTSPSVSTKEPHVMAINQFAPPPKPYRRPTEEVQSETVPVSIGLGSQEIESLTSDVSNLQVTQNSIPNLNMPPPLKPRPKVELVNHEEDTSKQKPKVPPTLKPKPKLDIDTVVKKAPPAIKPKPKFDDSRISVKPVPPSVKPKPQIISKNPEQSKTTPPPLKPKPSINFEDSVKKSNTPPPIKPKPTDLKTTGINSITAELQSKAKKENSKEEAKQEESDSGVVYEENLEDNPFKRYLKAAVPKEDDRFHRH